MQVDVWHDAASTDGLDHHATRHLVRVTMVG